MLIGGLKSDKAVEQSSYRAVELSSNSAIKRAIEIKSSRRYKEVISKAVPN